MPPQTKYPFALVYDLEIVNAIPDRRDPPIDGIAYCGGWDDYAGMGISVLCAYDYHMQQSRVFCADNLAEFGRLAAQRWPLVSFNGLGFDNGVLRVNGIPLDASRCFDLLAAITAITGSRKGRGLDAVCIANTLGMKAGHGALAPVHWQRGQCGAVIDYCVQDVHLTAALFDAACRGTIVDPERPASNLLLDLPHVERQAVGPWPGGDRVYAPGERL